MSDAATLTILISTNIASAAIAFLVTWAYWRDRHYETLRGIAKERRADATAIQNARIVEDLYGDTLGLHIMERNT